ncbi:MAG: 5'/3'-nucleotidase SurE [Anaerolineae bacterium]|nr:5'/3'-nucleotidase SurE [Anaerolineales bacterium]MCQ3971877.1 5'/3'-nucleotidase SurE [Anaerolineae bacterium]
MLILITNDDGINAPALFPLKQALDTVAETLVFAPDHNWSASGHPKTMHKPLRADPFILPDGSQGFVSTAPPPDCVALAMLGVVERKPDLVVSGINHGANLGYDVFYSGTVAAAVEATIEGLPAIAISRDFEEKEQDMAITPGFSDEAVRMKNAQIDYTPIAAFCARLAQKTLEHGLPANTLLNVNIPSAPWEHIKGVELTRLGQRVYRDELVARKDPRGRPYYWIGGLPPHGVPDQGTDIWALANNLISITPINLDITAYRFIEELKRWKLEEL